MNEMIFIHYLVTALIVAATSISVGISQGLTNGSACQAIDMQPKAKDEIMRIAILGSALIETTSIIGVFMSIILFRTPIDTISSYYADLAKLGIAFAICISGFVIGLVSAFPAQAACFSTARQPFFAQKIFRFMLISLSIIQTPLILAFIVALFIHNQTSEVENLAQCLRLIASGFAIGMGCVGPAIGLSLFSKSAIQGLGINRDAYQRLITFMFISQAIIETPIILSLIISFGLLRMSFVPDTLWSGLSFLAAGVAMGFGTLAPGLSSGKTAAVACTYIAKDPRQYSILSRTSMFAQGLIDTMAIYVLIISLLLIFFV